MKKTALFLIFAALFCEISLADHTPGHLLLEQAKKERLPRYNYAVKNGAEIGLTRDGKSFYVLWFPEGTDPNDLPPVIATIHGHGSWALEEFYHWHSDAKARGYGILALQWWLGKGERFQDYLTPDEIYRAFNGVFQEKKIRPGTVLFHGFSRGSANSYAVTALDNAAGRYFALTVANAGKPGLDFPPNQDIQNGKFGPHPLEGTHWVTYAGAKDTHPDRDGYNGMRAAAEWIRQYGGVVDLAIEDPDNGHGGFHQNPKNISAALDVFSKKITKKNPA